MERLFRDLIQNRLRPGVFRDVEELITAIGDYIDHDNQSPNPFIWTARAADILERVKRARRTLHKRQSETHYTSIPLTQKRRRAVMGCWRRI